MQRQQILVGVVLGWQLVCGGAAQAADANTHAYIAFGSGLRTCAEQVGESGLSLAAVTWMSGFLTAVNAYFPDTYDITNGSASWQWVSDYCRLNPTLPFTWAALAYVQSALPGRLQAVPPPVIPAPAPAPAPAPGPIRRSPRTAVINPVELQPKQRY